MKHLIITLLIIMALTPPATATELNYRVSGLIGQEERWLFAIIEDAQGGSKMYRKGDNIGYGRIVDITKNGVLADFGHGVQLLRLEGSSYISPASEDLRQISASPPFIIRGKLPHKELVTMIDTIATEVGKGKSPPDPLVINTLLDLPAKAKIDSINHQLVKSTDEILKTLQSALSSGIVVKINYTDGAESKNSYLLLGEPQSIAPQE